MTFSFTLLGRNLDSWSSACWAQRLVTGRLQSSSVNLVGLTPVLSLRCRQVQPARAGRTGHFLTQRFCSLHTVRPLPISSLASLTSPAIRFLAGSEGCALCVSGVITASAGLQTPRTVKSLKRLLILNNPGPESQAAWAPRACGCPCIPPCSSSCPWRCRLWDRC